MSFSFHWPFCARYFLNAANYGVSICPIVATLVLLVAEPGLSGCAPAVEYFDTDGFVGDGFVGDSLVAIRRWVRTLGTIIKSLFSILSLVILLNGARGFG